MFDFSRHAASRYFRVWALASAAAILSASAATAAEDRIAVRLDQARVLQLPEHTSTVIVGNPIIVDITVLKKANSVVLTGKGFGQTNLIAMDSSGKSLGESTIEVIPPLTTMTVQRGMVRQSYACDPRCEPTFSLGDDTQFTSDVSGQIQSRNTLAAPH